VNETAHAKPAAQAETLASASALKPDHSAPGLAAASAESAELNRAREIARRLGMINSEGQDFDIPAFMRRANDNANEA
jgi:hypothetical protein